MAFWSSERIREEQKKLLLIDGKHYNLIEGKHYEPSRDYIHHKPILSPSEIASMG